MFFKTSLANFILVLVSLGFTLAVLELALRFLGPPLASAPLIPDPVLHHVHLQDFVFKAYSPDNQFQPFTVYWDPQGLVADPEKLMVFDPARHRRVVAFVGDSFVESSQAPYAVSLVGRLNAAADPAVFVFNWGVSSYSPVIYLPLWRNKIRETKPAHVFLLLYENDVSSDTDYASKAEFGADGFPVSVRGAYEPTFLAWLRRSALFRKLRFAFVKIRAGIRAKNDPTISSAGAFQEVSPEISALTGQMICGLKNEVEATGARLTVLAVPSRRADVLGDPTDGPPSFASRVAVWCRQNGLDYIDLERPFLEARKKNGPGKLFYAKDIHFTPDGHAVTAETVVMRHPEYFSRR